MTALYQRMAREAERGRGISIELEASVALVRENLAALRDMIGRIGDEPLKAASDKD